AKKRDPAGRPITLTITGAHVQPEGDHRRVRVEFTATHHEPAPLSARPPHVRLLGATGDELPAFFVPGEFPPDLPSGTPAASWFEGWLTPAQAAAPLTLEVAGQKAAVVINDR